MSFIKKCDICGKTEKETSFSNKPFRLQIPNHENRKFNLYINVEGEDAEDTIKYEKMKNPEYIFKKSLEATELGIPEEQMEEYIIRSEKIYNPCPIICSKCKREMMKLVHSYGSLEGNPTF